MTPVIPSSISNISLLPGNAFITRKANSSARGSRLTLWTKQRDNLPRFMPIRVFPNNRICSALNYRFRHHILSATGTDVAVEAQDSPPVLEESGGPSTDADEPSKESSIKSETNPRRSRPPRKSEMPPVKNEELTPGATFSGKVRSIQPFGAFVDFGAFTDGLVHVSQLSNSFVQDVGSVVSIGQEVKVRLLEANMETGRISLSMRESDETTKPQPKVSASDGGDKPRGPRRKTEPKKTSKFVIGQDLTGTVKKKNRAGAYISLPEEEEGFLPVSEESDDGFESLMGNTSLEVGQEVQVRVLRITRGQATLTMKKEEDLAKLDLELSQGSKHTATNPFVLAFQKNKEISAFLSERKKPEQSGDAAIPDEVQVAAESKTDSSTYGDAEASKETIVGEGKLDDASLVSEEGPVTDEAKSDEVPEPSGEITNEISSTVTPTVDAALESKPETISTEDEQQAEEVAVVVDEVTAPVPIENLTVDEATSPKDEEQAEAAPVVVAEATPAKDEQQAEEAPIVVDEATLAKDERQAEEAPVVENEVIPAKDEQQVDEAPVVVDEATPAKDEKQTEEAPVLMDEAIPVKNEQEVEEAPVVVDQAIPEKDEEQAEEAPVLVDEVTATVPIAENKVEASTEENGTLSGSDNGSTEEVKESEVSSIENEVQEPESPNVSGIPSGALTAVEKDESSAEENGSAVSSNGQVTSDLPKESETKAIVSPALVKQLREETGAGMMDCKKALAEAGGDLVKAQEFLRKKGLASAEKKASRATAEGRIGSYIHDSRIGVLVEVNCETDFVSRGEIFKELADDLAMQVAACPQVQYLVTEDVPVEIVGKEKEIEMQKEDLLSKPEQIREKIVEGRIRKRLEELALLEQPYIKNDKVVVKDWVKQTIATIGENIKVKRFVRFNLGEGLEKKSQDFAAEVAAQTAAKPPPSPKKEEPAAVETVEKAPTVAVSAALVKQLREETGAGMMDCKKALSETGGDLEKAQEYLRKKGLSAADKKSSRLAAEGRIGSYIHDSRIGVLIEVNCETDFVGRSEKFKELVDDLAMQVVACPQVEFVSLEEVPESVILKEKELEMQREDLQSKPENIRERIVEGRVSKRLGELALLEQPFIKDDSILVKDLVKQTVAAIGENIKVRRFVRFTLGETTEDE